jgi:hypothetical protein
MLSVLNRLRTKAGLFEDEHEHDFRISEFRIMRARTASGGPARSIPNVTEMHHNQRSASARFPVNIRTTPRNGTKSSDLYAGGGMKLSLPLFVRVFCEYPFDYIGGYVQSASLPQDILEPTCFIAIGGI